MKLLVLIIDKYQEIEVYGFLGALNRSQKIEKITYWNPDGLVKVQGSNKIGFIETIIEDINVDDYDAIFVPGGAACISLRKNIKALNIIKEFISLDKWVFAICDGPNALYENNILNSKSYSSFPIENISKISGNKRSKEYITVDGKYITGKCPSAAIDLGIKVIEILYGKDLARKAHYGLYGLEEN